jgi:cytochrome P450
MEFQPYSERFAADPYPAYAALRESAPFFSDARFGMTFVSRYRDILAMLTDRRFGRVAPPGHEPANTRPPLPYYDRYVRVNLLETEGSPHRQLRRLLARAINPARIAALGARIESIARELVQRPAPGAEIDFIAELAEPLPVIMIAELLGWPQEERHRLRPWSADIVRLYEKDASGGDAVRAEAAAADFAAMIDALADERKALPRADLISELVAMEDEEDGLSRKQLIASCMLLLNAGHEATVNAAGNGLLALLRHGEVLNRLRAEPALIDSVVEEMLRYDPPLHLFHRFAQEDVTIGGHRFQAGDTIGLLYGSANRDPEVFEAPDSFDIERRPNRHLAFGAATHFCLGATLARLELKTLMGALLARQPHIELLEEQPEYRAGLVFRGLKRLMIRV